MLSQLTTKHCVPRGEAAARSGTGLRTIPARKGLPTHGQWHSPILHLYIIPLFTDLWSQFIFFSKYSGRFTIPQSTVGTKKVGSFILARSQSKCPLMISIAIAVIKT